MIFQSAAVHMDQGAQAHVPTGGRLLLRDSLRKRSVHLPAGWWIVPAVGLGLLGWGAIFVGAVALLD